MRNSLSATAVGLALVHFRKQMDDAPPLGGLLLITLGMGYCYGTLSPMHFVLARQAAHGDRYRSPVL